MSFLDISGKLGGLKPRLADMGFAAAWYGVPKVPTKLASRVTDAVSARIASRPGSLRQLRLNLRQVVGPGMPEGELDELVRRGMQSYARYWREVFSILSWDFDDVIARTEVTGLDTVRGELAKGKGVVIALTHSGNWDAAAIQVVHGIPTKMSTVAERLKPESLFTRFKKFREDLGMEVAPLTGGEIPSTAVLQRALRAGHTITLLGDRDIGGKGIAVELCGRATTMPSGPALLAIQTGAALMPLELGFRPNGWAMTYHDPIDIPPVGRLRARVTAATTQLADVYTGVVQRNPQDWHMLQPIWPDLVA